jgi:HPt (histidine-containing phosphotransfer) domain-containing protein
MQDHIAKPINPEQFYQTLARWLKPSPAKAADAGGADHSTVPLEIPGFDTADTLSRLAGDVELYHRVLEMLLPSLNNALQQFDAAAAISDRTGLQSVVHGVRGMAANIGAVTLTAAASELEDMLKARSEQPEQLTGFRAAVEQTLRLVTQGLETRKAAASRPMSGSAAFNRA